MEGKYFLQGRQILSNRLPNYFIYINANVVIWTRWNTLGHILTSKLNRYVQCLLLMCVCVYIISVYSLVFQEGLILVGGNGIAEVSINLNTLAAKQQSIVGIPKGTVEQLRELVDIVSDKKVNALSTINIRLIISVISKQLLLMRHLAYISVAH